MVVTFGDGELEDPSYQPLIESGLHSWFFRNNLALGHGGSKDISEDLWLRFQKILEENT